MHTGLPFSAMSAADTALAAAGSSVFTLLLSDTVEFKYRYYYAIYDDIWTLFSMVIIFITCSYNIILYILTLSQCLVLTHHHASNRLSE